MVNDRELVRESVSAPADSPEKEMAVARLVENDARLYRELALFDYHVAEESVRWKTRIANPRRRFLGKDGRVNMDILRNFLRFRIYNSDNPRRPMDMRNPLNWLIGPRRGEIAILKNCLRRLREFDCLDILERRPAPLAGNPYVFETGGLRLTHRWFRDIYKTGLLRKTLGGRLPNDFIALDIGGACGSFSSLIHQEFAGSHNVLVDFPEQLLLARYFLTVSLPEARIAGISELAGMETIPREFFAKFDFVLLPPTYYQMIEAGAVDLITSFLALHELTLEFFNYYIQAPVFQGSRFFATAAPIEPRSKPGGADEVWMLDFPFGDLSKRIHFAISGAYDYTYSYPKSRFGVGYRLKRFRPYFEYVGEIRGAGCES